MGGLPPSLWIMSVSLLREYQMNACIAGLKPKKNYLLVLQQRESQG